MSSLATGWRSLCTQIWDYRSQLGLSLRVTIAAAASYVIAQALHVPLPLWTVLTAVILTQISFGKSVKATFDYLVGTLFGAIYAAAVAALLPHASEPALVGVLAVAVAPLALIGAINPTFSAATFTGVLVLLIPGITHVGPIESAFYRVIEVAVGGITALVISLLVLPARANTLTIQAAAQVLFLLAKYLPDLLSCLMRARDQSEFAPLHDAIGKAFAQSDATAAEAKHERINFFAPEFSSGPLLRTLLRLRHDLVMIGRAAVVPLPETFQAKLGPQLAQVTKTATDYLRQSGEALAARRNPPSFAPADAALGDFATGLAEARHEGLTVELPVDAVERVFALSFALDQLRRNFRDLERCVAEAAHWR
ncbi:MAG TPA: FUSC family protein [Pseudolabrys sp.]